jgi:capsular polysaccharide biosynthesis protein
MNQQFKEVLKNIGYTLLVILAAVGIAVGIAFMFRSLDKNQCKRWKEMEKNYPALQFGQWQAYQCSHFQIYFERIK